MLIGCWLCRCFGQRQAAQERIHRRPLSCSSAELPRHAVTNSHRLLPMKKNDRQRGWRLGGSNAPAWLQAPCAPAIKKSVRADLELLRETFDFARLPESHPLRRLWDCQGDAKALAEARFEFHHLASDLRVVHGVSGWQGLRRAMVSDADGYADYRYELRTAGTVGRSAEQKLVRLGAKGKGADIEVRSKSGHLCAIACYRAQSITPALRELPLVTFSLAQTLGNVVATNPVDAGIDMLIEFSAFPIGDEERLSAIETFRQVWNNLDNPQASQDGVTVSRTGKRPSFSPGNWEVRLTFRVPVPAREKRRLANNIRDKLVREHAQWASSYTGFRVFCVEESDWSLGAEQDEIKALLASSSPHSFDMIVCTWPFFADNLDGGQMRVEQMRWFPREGAGSGVNLGMESFGENFESYCKDHVVSMHNPVCAEEEWILRLGVPPANVAGSRIRELSIQRTISRMPAPKDGRMPTADELLPLVRRTVPGKSR